MGKGEVTDNATFDSLYNDKFLGANLFSTGIMYFAQLDLERKMIAENYDIHSERYLSVCVVSYNLDMTITSVVGGFQRVSINRQGTMLVDLQYDATSEISLNNNSENLSNYRMNVGIKSSYLEAEVLEKATGIESVSTMRIFDKCIEKNIDIISISKKDSNYNQLLNNLSLSSRAVSEVREAVLAGHEVIVPVKNVSVNRWNGTGYIIIEKTDNGENYTFRLSNGSNNGGGLYQLAISANGGVTTEWIDEIAGRGEELFVQLYWLSVIVALTTAILAGGAVIIAVFAGAYLKSIFLGVVFAYYSWCLYDTIRDLNSYYDGNETSIDKFKTSGNIILSLIFDFFIVKYVFGN